MAPLYRYFYASGKLMRMTWGSNTVDFFYDANGTPYAMKYNGTLYYYVTNLQGDVMRVVNASGTVVASYDYDPYGKVISATGTLANINPLRYRGYVYDTETGFYYVSSRYYDPAIGRFINADNQIADVGSEFLGYNMFAYCMNNPINMLDSTGNWPEWVENVAKAVAVVAVVAVVVTATVVVTVATAGTGGVALAAAGVAFGTACGGLVGGIANENKGESFINGWAGGAVNGFTQSFGTATFGPAGTIVGGGVGSGLGTAVTESLNNRGKPKNQQKSSKVIFNDSLKSAAIGAAMSTITAGIGYSIDYAQSPSGYNSWSGSLNPGVGIAPITPGFGEIMKGFFGSVDDALGYILCE